MALAGAFEMLSAFDSICCYPCICTPEQIGFFHFRHIKWVDGGVKIEFFCVGCSEEMPWLSENEAVALVKFN